MRYFFLFLLFLYSGLLYSQKAMTKQEIAKHCIQSRIKSRESFPSYLKFDGKFILSIENHTEFLHLCFDLSQDYSLIFEKKTMDNLGWEHFQYGITYKGVIIENNVLKIQKKGDVLISIVTALNSVQGSSSPSLTQEQAILKSLDLVAATKYKWEFPEEEALLKRELENVNASYFPNPELVWYAPKSDGKLNLCYKVDVYAQEPLSRQILYLDAHTNDLIGKENKIHTADSNGVAVTVYSGNRAIVADYFSSQFRLRETGRGNGVQTFNLNNGSNYGTAVDFIDDDNNWNNTANQDQYAGDAHWGAEMTYDYFWQVHNRNSIDGNGFLLKSYVHYNTAYNNAFWDGLRMTYGDGNGTTFDPLTAIDITGHEIAHGLTSNTANLAYSNESGALNESFSDIFGVSVESFANNNALNWIIGEDATPNGNGIRNMSNPNAFSDPDTYLGTNYYTGTQDNGGVHTNSGVQNFWYYLLAVGGSGTNDIGNAYTVNGLGTLNASKIAFRNLTFYLSPNSDYQDARFYAIQSAIDIFGACSPEVMATTNAWYAVGVGQVFSYTVNAQFSTAFQDYCQSPAMVNFMNESFNAGTFNWDFGDGQSSSLLNPTHIYQNPGDYTVTLIVSGGACGIDTLVLVDYIHVDPNLPCAITMNPNGSNQVQTACSGTIFDPGGLASNYQDLVTSEITIAPTSAASITLNFSSFDLELDYDYLYIYDGNSSQSPLIGQYTGNVLPNGGTIQSTYGAVTLKFFSDTYLNNPGFVMTWNCQIPTTPPNVDFHATSVTSCDGDIQFIDETTLGPNTWLWDFGDGATSNLQNPSHNYAQDGLFTVSLIAGNMNGTDTLTMIQYISIDRPDAPIANDIIICSPDTVVLSALASGDISMYDAEIGGNLLQMGNQYSTYLSITDTIWMENTEIQNVQYVGPLDNTIGTGGQHNNASTQYLVFSVNEPLTIVSAWVNAGATGDRTITLWDANGNQLDTRFLNIPNGGSRIALNFHLEPGVGYRMGGMQMNLYRNNAGAVFPYQIPGLISITGSSAGGAYYYYFYDWEIVKDPCISPRVPVALIMDEVQASANVNSVGMTVNVLSNTSINATQYLWNFGDGGSSTNETPSYSFQSPGTYTMNMIASNSNCSDTIVFDVTVDDAGLSEVMNGTLLLFPNPSNSSITVSGLKGKYSYFEILDVTGRIIHKQNLGATSDEMSFDVKNLTPGGYFIRLNNEIENFTLPFVRMD